MSEIDPALKGTPSQENTELKSRIVTSFADLATIPGGTLEQSLANPVYVRNRALKNGHMPSIAPLKLKEVTDTPGFKKLQDELASHPDGSAVIRKGRRLLGSNWH